MRTIAILLAILMAFAGCIDKDAIAPPVEEEGEEPGPGEGMEPGGGEENGTNTPPTVTMLANVTTESAPFVVVFQLNGTDADNDTLSWMLDADGDGVADQNGSMLPANATFEYAAEGIYNVTLNVTDGVNHASLNITLTLQAAGLPALPPWVGSGVADAPCPQCREAGANTGAGYRGGVSGLDSVFVALPPEYIGYPFVATASAGDIDVSFRTACSGGGAIGDPFAGSGDEAGVVPDGTGCVLMWNFDTPDSTLTITVG